MLSILSGLAVLVIMLAVIMASIAIVTFSIVFIMKRAKPELSPYKVYAITDLVGGCLFAIYGIYDILTDTGFLAGILGMMILVYVVPCFAVSLVIEYIVYKRKTKHSTRASAL